MAFDLSIQDIDRLKSNPDIEILEQFGSRQWYITLNNKKAPTDDILVRKAINLAVDKQGIIDSIYLGTYASIARAVYLMPTIDGYSDAGAYEYDPEQAVALLEEAGWVDADGDGVREKDGQPLALDLYTRQGGAAGDIETAELVQAMLAEVGIQTNIIVEDGASFVASVTKVPEEATYHMANLSVGVYTGDAEYIMLTFYACDSAAPRYYNRAYFCDPAVDALIEESEATTTMEARNEIYAQINKMVFDQAPILQLFDVLQTVAIHSNVEGVYFEPAGNNWPGKYAWLEQ
jgi:ABC-type transport system substrate-binding protein